VPVSRITNILLFFINKKTLDEILCQIGERAAQFEENYDDNPSYYAKGQCAICLVCCRSSYSCSLCCCQLKQ